MKILHAALSYATLFIAAALAPVNAQIDAARDIMAPVYSRVWPLAVVCFDVKDGKYFDGALLVVVPCNKKALLFVWPGNPMDVKNPTGPFQVVDAITNIAYCIDATRDALQRGNSAWIGMTIYTCNGSPQQRLIFYGEHTPEGAIGISGTDPARCIDLKNSARDNNSQVGTYPCSQGDKFKRQNQIFSYITSDYDYTLDYSGN